MKGFVRVFESIIASIVLIVSLTFFFTDSAPQSGWESTTLQTLSQDVLQSAYYNGTITKFVKNNDKTSLNSRISQMLPSTVDFSLYVKGLPNDIIRIACVDCTISELSEMETILAPLDFEYRGRKISIRTEQINLTPDDIKEETNTLFFFNKSKVVFYEIKIRDFLETGGSAMLLDDLIQADANGPVGEMFNLTWSAGSAPPGLFYDTADGRNISHFIAKYYANISGKNLENIPPETFTVFNSGNVAVIQDTKNVIRDSGTRVFARANYDIENNEGRSVWFADYDRVDHNAPATKAIDNVLKASLMWASGEYYSMDTIKKDPAPIHFKSSIVIYDDDMYVFEIVVWRAFF